MIKANAALLHLMHIVSPALPVGAYAYSQGLEYAIDAKWLNDEQQIHQWLQGVMTYGVGKLDLPVLIRSYKAWSVDDLSQVYFWNARLQAWRETHELLMEDQQLGAALLRLLESLSLGCELGCYRDNKPSFVTVFARAGTHWNIPLEPLLQGFVYSWLENQIAAATKVIPLGQTQAQRLLLALIPDIESVCEQALTIADDDLGYSLPGLAMASALHERQYSRLFRS